MEIKASGNTLHIVGVEWIEGEANSSNIRITLLASQGGVDLSALHYTMIGESDHDTGVEQVLEKQLEGGYVLLAWPVKKEWAAIAGSMRLELRGQDTTGNMVKKWQSPQPVRIKPSCKGGYQAVPDIAAQLLDAMRTLLAQADEDVETTTAKAAEAAGSATAAKNSQTAAKSSETAAAGSKSAAATSAGTASTKATEAAGSASTASTKATEAAASAAAAKASQTAAKTSETNAASSKAAAAGSETAAAASKTAAAGSASTASTKAAEAAASAAAAKVSETNAKTSETNAASSKTGAATSATAAADSARLAKDQADRAVQAVGVDLTDLKQVGTSENTYIAYPKDGRYRTGPSSGQKNPTGYLKITIPTPAHSMVRFEVDIYNHRPNTSCTYSIGGYTDTTESKWLNCFAYSLTGSDMSLGNLPVHFGLDGANYVIYIGQANTSWSYPQISIKDITVGHAGAELAKWISGWNISFVTELGTISAIVENPNAFARCINTPQEYVGNTTITTRSTDRAIPKWAGKTTVTGAPSETVPATITGKSFKATAASGGKSNVADSGLIGYSLPNGAADECSGGVFTRRAYRLELSGTESWAKNNAEGFTFYVTSLPTRTRQSGAGGLYCTHFNPAYVNALGNVYVLGTINTMVIFPTQTYASTAAWASWLAAEKAAGRPVTVYYELATPTITQASTELACYDGSTTLTGADGYTVIDRRECGPKRTPDYGTVKVYGVQWPQGSSVSAGTRIKDAVGMVAEVGVDNQVVRNDFDNVWPWAGRRVCNGCRREDGEFVVTAYNGEPGFSRTDPNKLVYVETPLFYWFDGVDTDGYEKTQVSMYPVPGFLPSPACIRPDGTLRQKSYSAAYLIAMEGAAGSEKPTSRSKVFSDYNSLNGWATDIKKLGAQYTGMLIADQYIDTILMRVEFATKDIQTVMRGCSTLPYSADHKALAAEASANRILITKAQAARYVVGQAVSISTSAAHLEDVAKNRTITAITDKSVDETYLYFDGAAVAIGLNNIVSSRPWVNGAADVVAASSGSPVDNTSGKYPCKYRGKENPYGNAWINVADLLAVRKGAEGSYTYHMAYLPDPTKYAAGVASSDYVELDYQMPGVDGYVREWNLDKRYPFIRMAKTLGASSTNYYADYYVATRDAVGAVIVGGHLSDGRVAGPCSLLCWHAPSYSDWLRRARLS